MNIAERGKKNEGGGALKCVPETLICHLDGGLWFLKGVSLLWPQRMNANKLSCVGTRTRKNPRSPVPLHHILQALQIPCCFLVNLPTALC